MYLTSFTIGLHDRVFNMPIVGHGPNLICALHYDLSFRTEKISSNDVAMATIAYARRVLTPQQEQQEQQQVDNRLS